MYKKPHILAVTMLTTGLVAALLSSCQPRHMHPDKKKDITAPKPDGFFSMEQAGGKILMMHYMPWYFTPEFSGGWGSHWTGHQKEHDPDQVGTDGLPDIWSHYHPLIGLYDSTDPAVLECHLLEMKLAGVNGVIVDWYGISDTADYPPIHKASRAMFDATQDFGMKFAACYEDRSVKLMVERNELEPGQITNHLVETFQWMQEAWFSQPNYLQHQGRPLLLNFGPIYLNTPGPWSAAMKPLPVRPMFFGLHHIWKTTGADGGFTWIHHEPWEGTPTKETILTRIGEVFTYFSTNEQEVIVSAYPGYHDVYQTDSRKLPHRDGNTLRETLEVGMAGPWPIIQLVTWNDYGEGTIIEPTHEFGYTFLEIIQEARRKELGEQFPFTPEDLRLPARLFQLRKQGDISADTLAYISQMLARGYTQMARLEIEKAETPPTSP